MCVVVDLNLMPAVFNKECSDHSKYAPINKWIIAGKGKLVFGGSKYMSELEKAGSYRSLVIELRKSAKAVKIIDSKVDEVESEVCNRTRGANFNDQHIIALLDVSNCPLLCSNDSRSYDYIKDTRYYPSGRTSRRLPRIYSFSRYKTLIERATNVRLTNVA